MMFCSLQPIVVDLVVMRLQIFAVFFRVLVDRLPPSLVFVAFRLPAEVGQNAGDPSLVGGAEPVDGRPTDGRRLAAA
jgi:hypothetical protein